MVRCVFFSSSSSSLSLRLVLDAAAAAAVAGVPLRRLADVLDGKRRLDLFAGLGLPF